MKIGIYVDGANIALNGGYQMRYDVLKKFCTRDGDAIRMNTYMVFDEERGKTDIEYRDRQYGYYNAIRNIGFKVITKPVRWFRDEEGNRYGKGNADLDMAVDIMLQAERLDKIYILSGDGDFKKAINAIQNMGVRVEVIAFKNVSHALQFEADQFQSGYLIPDLTPLQFEGEGYWGEVGSRVRGQVLSVNEGYGFIRMMNTSYGFENVFFHFSELPSGHTARVDFVYEFKLSKSERGLQASAITTV